MSRNSQSIATYRSEDIFRIFNVDYLASVAVRKVTIGQAANGQTPTIAAVSTTMNNEVCCTVIKAWILSINAYVGKECFSPYQAKELAAIISAEGYYLTLCELAIFFNWVKAGKFGQIYGQLDPVFITSSLQEFLLKRREAIDKYDRDNKRKEIESQDNGNIIKATISLGSYQNYRAKVVAEMRKNEEGKEEPE